MIKRIILAVVIGVVVTLVCILVGALLTGLGVHLATVVGDFLSKWSGVLGVLAAIWWYFSGSTLTLPK